MNQTVLNFTILCQSIKILINIVTSAIIEMNLKTDLHLITYIVNKQIFFVKTLFMLQDSRRK